MPFHFTLAPLLRLRHSVERQRALQLREASLRVIRMQEFLERLDRFLKKSSAADQPTLRSGVRAAELHFAEMSREQLAVLKLTLCAELKELEVARTQAANQYQQAYREREALESLQEQQRRRYQQENLRREQRELDAAFLLQRWHNR